MSKYSLFVLLCVITAMASYINFKYLKLPKAIGLTVVSALISLFLFAAIRVRPEMFSPIYTLLDSVDFKEVVLKGILGYLLFASAMHLSLVDLKKHMMGVLALSSIGVLISTFIIGTVSWIIAPLVLNTYIPYVACLLVGAVISPTDPVTVFAVFKTNKDIPTKIKLFLAGEALFNDVVSIVLFVILVSIAFGGTDASGMDLHKVFILVLREGVGGIALGIIMGSLGVWFMHRADEGQTLILVSLALVSCGFWLAEELNVSGPLVMVITGLIIGNSKIIRNKLSKRSKKSLNEFWLVIDELLNAFLFVLVGVEILEMKFTTTLFFAGVLGFIITIITRYISVALPMYFLDKENTRKNNIAMTWGGLRGGVSIALALSIPFEDNHAITFSIIYITVLLSIFVQGITFKPLLDKLYK